MNNYPRRRKKMAHLTIVGKTKIVRVDHRTQIEVSVDISDEEAINRFYSRQKIERPLRRPPIEDTIDFNEDPEEVLLEDPEADPVLEDDE